jgi:hypothetical protein
MVIDEIECDFTQLHTEIANGPLLPTVTAAPTNRRSGMRQTCDLAKNPNEVDTEGYPEVCGDLHRMRPSKPGRMKKRGLSAKALTIQFLATQSL